MKRILKYTESNNPIDVKFKNVRTSSNLTEAIASAVNTIAKEVSATAIVAGTKSGATALAIASLRPNLPIIAVTNDQIITNQLTLVYGVKSYTRTASKYSETKLTNWLEKNKVLKKGETVVTASGKYPGVVGATDTIKVRVI